MQLKAFAEAKGPVSSSDTEYKGFTVRGSAKVWAYLTFYVPTTLLMMSTFLLYMKIIITKWMNNLFMYTYKPYWVLLVTALFIKVYIACEFYGAVF